VTLNTSTHYTSGKRINNVLPAPLANESGQYNLLILLTYKVLAKALQMGIIILKAVMKTA